VTVFDRDELPGAPVTRRAVPQGRHLHILMARGAAEFEALFPGLLDEMVAAGVPMLENRPDCIHFGAAGHVLGTGQHLRDTFTAYVPSRPHLEWQLRRRTGALGNVEIRQRAVTEPHLEADTQRVTGVILDVGNASDSEFIAADLVVEATGRGTRLPVWLDVGLPATQGGYCRRGDLLCLTAFPHPRRLDSGASGRLRSVPAATTRAGHARLRGRHLGSHHLRCGQNRAAA
jgi:hypothetical protein